EGVAMRPRCVCLLVPVLLVAGCSAGQDRPADALDVHEAVIRHQLPSVHQVEGPGGPAIHVTVLGEDPSPELLRRFEGSRPALLPGSRLEPKKGVLIHIDSVKWIDRTTVEVEGGYNSRGIDGSQHLYRLQRRDGKWVVIDDTITAIS